MAAHFVIVGNGAAGLSAAEEIRRRDTQARITILSDEPHLFYSRPGLAYYLSGEIPERRVFARTPQYYHELRLDLVHQRCEQIWPADHTVELADGRRLRYDALLIAVGNRAVPAPFPGADLDGVVYLDMLDQAREIVRRTRKAHQAVVIGGGITALELVEGFHARGVHTHYLLRRDRYWPALLSEDESRLIEDRLEEMGVVLHRNTEVVALEGRRGRVHRAHLSTGETLACDLVGVAIGVRPNLALAKQAGLRTDRGILVDEYLRTSAPDVYAAGDVAQIRDRWSGEYRLDSLWPSAIASGRAAGANMAGANEPYEKGIPFNVARLCGIMLTAIGQAAAQRTPDEARLDISRGSSQVWTAMPASDYARLRRARGSDSIRLVVRDNVLVGALVLGNQSLVTPLLELIGAEVDVSEILPQLWDRERPFADVIEPFWRTWKASQNGHGRPQD
ncbi:MAG: NAD(P)/FAD-dependent oxidoreductase [Chloroflexi bacterium]|nr:MAG: NAD(P)/FAD-dependent oxidoreductase [Chloroflexota bacterium]